MQRLNLTTNPYKITTYQIENSTIKVETRYNVRLSSWLLSLYDSSNNAILTSLRLLPNEYRNLTGRYRVSSGLDDYFTGNFYSFALDDTGTELTLDNLGTAWDVYYLTSTEEETVITDWTDN